jgi:xanthine dehydrogenase accessory factor
MDSTQYTVDIHEEIVKFIDNGRPFAVALVLRVEGSTPRQAGVRAVIDLTGKIWGTIGGGVVEAEAQRLAVEACRSKLPVVFDLQLQGAKSTDETPICGGIMRILIDPTVTKDRACHAQVADAIRLRQRGVMLTTARSTKNTEVSYQWFPQDAIPSDVPFPGIQNIHSCLDREAVQLFTEGSHEPNVLTEVLVEPVIPRPLLLVAGGGHIGQALAYQANLVGFDVTVIDERPEFTNPDRFPDGTRTCCGDMGKQIAALVEDDTYVVIVTRGHKLDADTLEACIRSPAAYIGMIGSKRKVALMRKHFIESALAMEEEFDRVFAPIGLDIGAVTVPEIATSIIAELIAVRRKGIVHKVPANKELS